MQTRYRLLRIAVLGFFVSTTSSVFCEGLYWESTSTGGRALGPGGDQPRLSKTYAMPKKLKREDADMTVIVRLDKEAFYMLRPKDKTYSEIAFADMDKAMKGLTDQLGGNEELKKKMEEMKKQLKDLPPEQRAVFEKQFKNNPLFKDPEAKEAKLEVAKTAEKREIAGRKCLKYVAQEDGKDVVTAWTTTDLKEFAPLREDWVAVQKRVTAMNPMFGKSKAQAFDKIEGFPMETEMSGVKTVVTLVEPRSTPDSEFEIPADYTKSKSPLEGGAIPGLKGLDRKGLDRNKGLDKKAFGPKGESRPSEPKPIEPKTEPKE